MTDFGFATRFDPGQKQNLSLGSPLYMAPELVREEYYDFKVDVWAVGVITFSMVAGEPPFFDRSGRPSKEGIYNSIEHEEPPYELLGDVSDELREFIDLCVKKDPRDRPMIAELLKHSWILSNRSELTLDEDRQRLLTANLATFHRNTQFQSAICSVMANMMGGGKELRELRELFVKWDENSDGFLSKEEISKNIAEIIVHLDMSEAEVEQMMRAADTNRDGRVDYIEFVTAAYDRVKLLSLDNIGKAFKLLDQDGDGQVTGTELNAVFGGAQASGEEEEVWNTIMQSVDADGDGQISFEEFRDTMLQVLDQVSAFTQ